MVAKEISNIDQRFVSFLQLGIEAVRELKTETAAAGWYTKTVKLPVQESGTVSFPQDFHDYHYVGLCCEGSIVGLTFSPDMCPPMTDDCGDLQRVNRGRQVGYFMGGHDIYGRGRGMSYGNAGFFKPYYDKGYFVIQELGIAIDEIILIYEGDLYEQDGDYLVFPNDAPAIKYYIEMRRSEMSERGRSGVDMQWRHRRWVQEKRRARMKNNPIKPQDILNAIRK